MIPLLRLRLSLLIRKPRASGDDPALRSVLIALAMVNPARAGMIPSML